MTTYTVTTLAGFAAGFLDATGTAAKFSFPQGAVADSSGNIYVSDLGNNRIRKITPAGVVTTFAGSATAGFANNANPLLATFTSPTAIAIDSSGNLYVSDGNSSDTNTIRKITPAGVVTTIPGSGAASSNGTGLATPKGLVLDASGNLYVADTGSYTIRKVTPAGTVTTVAGSGSVGSANGTGTGASFSNLQGITIDSSGNLYVTDYNNNRIRKITPAGVVTYFAGSGTAGSADGTGTSATFNGPLGINIDSSGNLYVTEGVGHRIRMITPAGVVTTVAGSSTSGSANGVGTAATFASPASLAIDASGNLTIADNSNHLIRKITVTAPVDITPPTAPGVPTVTGTTSSSVSLSWVGSTDDTAVSGYEVYYNGPSFLSGMFTNPRGTAVDSSGNVYVVDSGSNRIRKVTPTGVVTTLAGSGTAAFADGTGALASFSNPYGIAVDSSGNVYVADTINHRIRKITPAGVVTTLAGSGSASWVDGTGSSASFNSPRALACDSSGNVYVADTLNNRIRKITPAGAVTTLAGSGSANWVDGTGAAASFYNPYGIIVDSSGNIYVSDTNNQRIRKVTSAGVVTTLAGNGTSAATDGTGAGASFNAPRGLACDSSGNVYVADSNNQCIRKVTPAGVVTTLAGGTQGFLDATGTAAMFNVPFGVACDSSGNLYVADFSNQRIRKITPAGGVTTFAGSGSGGYYDSSSIPSRLYNPSGVTVDSFGNVYVADQANQRIRKITSAGVVTTLAGSGSNSFADGTGTAASFNNPRGVACDSSGNVYVADFSNNRIRKVTPAGVVTTLAGSGTATWADGTGAAASFSNPYGLAVDFSGNVYVADTNNNRIRKITPAGVVTTFAGSGTATYADATGTAAGFNAPYGVAVDSSGNVYVADTSNHCIRKVTPAGVVTNLAGSRSPAFADGTGSSASFNNPRGVVCDSSGNVYVGDSSNNRIRKITPAGVVTTLAGSGSNSFAEGTGVAASFNAPYGVAIDSSGNVYVADLNNYLIRKVTSAGVVTTLAGTVGTTGYADAQGLAPAFYNAFGVTVDSSDTIYVADGSNHRIRKLTSTGAATTLAGSGTPTFADGTGSSASFNNPRGVACDSSGNVYVADFSNNRIRKVTPAGVVTTLAGSGTATWADDTGAAASFNSPISLTIDSSGNVYVADSSNHRIRKVTPAGVVTTLAGSGTPTFADGTGSSASFNSPRGVACDSVGNVYVADSSNHRIRKVTPAGVVTTLAGSGTPTFADGTGSSASFYNPYGVTVASSGNIYVADSSNNLIRMITPAGVVTTLAGSGSSGLLEGTGTAARFSTPSSVALDSMNNLYVADYNNQVIRKITPAGVVTTLSGTPFTLGYRDSYAFMASLGNVTSATIPVSPGNGYVFSVRAIDPSGNRSSVSGSSASTSITSGPPVPATPDAPTASLAAVPSRTVTVTWSAVSGATTYTLFSGASQVATGISDVSYAISNVADGTYTYTITATNATGTSSPSPSSSSLTVDRTSPTVPAGLTAAQNTVGSRDVTLSWTASTDATGVTGYQVYRGATLVGSPTGTTFTDTPTTDGTYSYTVKAGDAAGNWSASSTAANVTVDTTPPTVPNSATLSLAASPSRTLTATWNTDSDVALYEVTFDGVVAGTTSSATYTFNSVTDGTHQIIVRARDTKGNWSGYSSTSSIIVDRTPPDVPAAPTFTRAVGSKSVVLSWASVSSSSGYRVYRDGGVVGTPSSNTYTDTVSADGTLSYTVEAGDAAGNWSGQSPALSVTVDTTPPSVGTVNVARTSMGTANRAVTMNWTMGADTVAFEVQRNGTTIGNGTTQTTFSDTPDDDGVYTYGIRAKDQYDNWSSWKLSSPITVDTTPPSTPVVSATVTATTRNVSISWNSNTDATGYEISRDGSVISTTTGTTAADTVPTDGTFVYSVRSKDASNNWGNSGTATVTVDTVPPTVPTINTSVVTGTRNVTVSWTGDTDVAAFEVRRNGTTVTSSAGGTFYVDTTPADGTFIYTVRAKDATGNWSGYSNGSQAVVDTVPPAVPTNVRGDATRFNILVSWTGASDAVAYDVLRDGQRVAGSAFTSVADTVPTYGTYHYKVRAQDAAGNWSQYSDEGVVEILDTDPPAVPVNVKVNVIGIKKGNITWDADPDVSVWEVYRNGVLLISRTTNSFVDTVADYGTYTYSIRAKDIAGNWSAQSEVTANSTVKFDSGAPTLGRSPIEDITITRLDEHLRHFRRMNRDDQDQYGGFIHDHVWETAHPDEHPTWPDGNPFDTAQDDLNDE